MKIFAVRWRIWFGRDGHATQGASANHRGALTGLWTGLLLVLTLACISPKQAFLDAHKDYSITVTVINATTRTLSVGVGGDGPADPEMVVGQSAPIGEIYRAHVVGPGGSYRINDVHNPNVEHRSSYVYHAYGVDVETDKVAFSRFIPYEEMVDLGWTVRIGD